MKRIIMILCAAVLVVYACRVNFASSEKKDDKVQTITANGADAELLSPAPNGENASEDVTEVAANPEEEVTITDAVVPLAPEAEEGKAAPEV